MKRISVAVTGAALAGSIVLFQNCAVHRLENAAGLASTETSGTSPSNSSGSLASSSSSGGGGSSPSTSCKAAPTNLSLGSFVLSKSFQSVDAYATRINSQYLKQTSISLFEVSDCVQPSHSCSTETGTTTSTTCSPHAWSTLTISFKCSDSSTSTTCDSITPGTRVDLTNGTPPNNLSISLQDSSNVCDSARTKTFSSMSSTTYKTISGFVTYSKVDGTSAGKQIEVLLENVVLETMDSAKSRVTISGRFASDISCSTSTNL